jgi:geranylgeranyl pyrophosphate synthase
MINVQQALEARVLELEQELAEARAPSRTTVDDRLAIDKFARMPGEHGSAEEMAFPMTAKGPTPQGPDPFKLVAKDLKPLTEMIPEITESNKVTKMAVENQISKFLEHKKGKQLRPTIVALMARTLAQGPAAVEDSTRQLQLGTITEMIHLACLVHDDVLDEEALQRQEQSSRDISKRILAGDFLLARASLLLARLQQPQVVEVMAVALDSVVQGELQQIRPAMKDIIDMEFYLRKSYFKTGSLISSSCKSAALLAGYEESDPLTVAAEEFGYHLGMAYRIVDDILDFTGSSGSSKNPSHMELGLATAPILFASAENPWLLPLIQHRFQNDGDIQKALDIASGTDCIEKSYKLAEFHAQKGLNALMRMPPSDSRDALVVLMHNVLSGKA